MTIAPPTTRSAADSAAEAFQAVADGGAAEEGKQWTVARPPTPFIDETGESKGWNELIDHHEWSFRAQQRKPLAPDEVGRHAAS